MREKFYSSDVSWFIFFKFYLFEMHRGTEKETKLSPDGCLPKFSRIHELSPGLPQKWQRPTYLSHHLLPPWWALVASQNQEWSQDLNIGTGPGYHLNAWAKSSLLSSFFEPGNQRRLQNNHSCNGDFITIPSFKLRWIHGCFSFEQGVSRFWKEQRNTKARKILSLESLLWIGCILKSTPGGNRTYGQQTAFTEKTVNQRNSYHLCIKEKQSEKVQIKLKILVCILFLDWHWIF